MEELLWKPKKQCNQLSEKEPVVRIETNACFPQVSPAQILLEAHFAIMRTFFQAIEIMFGIRK